MPWTATPCDCRVALDAQGVVRQWPRLHAGDAQALPDDKAVLAAWVLYHRGDFEAAFRAGLEQAGAGFAVANKACCMYANYLEPSEKCRLALFMEVAQRAEALATSEPMNPAAWYWQAYALGRYSQGISVAKALAEGLGARIRRALERTIELEPLHADAHIALGAFHAEVIDKVGPLIGRMTYGARKDVGLAMYRKALALNPHSAMARIEYARGLVMLEGESGQPEASLLYQQAVALEPADAKEALDRSLAMAELKD